MWHEGTIGIPMQDGGYKIAHYWVKSFDEGSEWGINGGRISKLQITRDGQTVVNYDRGWDIKPVSAGDKDFYNKLLAKFN